MFRAFRILFINELVTMLRQPANIFFVVFFPLFFLGIMLFSFGSDGTLGPVTVEVVDKDRSGLSADYIERVRKLFKSSGVITGEVIDGDPQQALGAGRIRITLPTGFESAVIAGHETRVRLEYNAANSMLTQIATRVFDPLTMRFNIDTAQSATPARLEYKNVTGFAQISFPQYLVTGILVMSMLSTGVFSTAVVIAFRREQNTFKLMSCLPMGPGHILAAIVAARGLVILIAGLSLLLFAVKVLGMPIEIDLPRMANAAGLIGVGGLCLLALGLMVSARLSTVQGAIFAANLVYIALLFLSDLTVPLRNISTGVLSFLQYLPTAAFVNSLRSVLVHGQTLAQQWQPIGVMLAWTAVFLLITRFTFRWHRS